MAMFNNYGYYPQNFYQQQQAPQQNNAFLTVRNEAEARSHAVAQFPIWKYTKKKMSEDEAQEKGFYFLKKASWFTREQVEIIDELQK